MGIDWMSRTELAEAIPPAFTEWIGAPCSPTSRRWQRESVPLRP
jgi:hypothetical protein